MESHEVLKRVLKNTSAKQVASDLGVSISLVYKWAEPTEEAAGSGATNPLDRVAQLVHSTHDPAIAQWVCERAGGFFTPNTTGEFAKTHLVPAVSSVIEEQADMMHLLAEVASDQHISSAEASRLRLQWEKLKSITEAFVRAAEAGKYR